MNNKGFFNRILSNNIVLMVLSLVIAFVSWFFITANSETESNKIIPNIPIDIHLSQEAIDDGLQIFEGADATASVEVSGNRLVVGSLSAADIQVVALQSTSIIAKGSYTLELTAKKAGVKTNYNFASNVSPSAVNVYVDRYKEKVFDITDEIAYKVEKGYYANSSLSETSVTVSGPETEVLKIDKVVVKGSLDGSDGNSKKKTFELVYLDKDGNVLDITMSETNVKNVDVTLTPLPIREVSLDVEPVNAPKNYPSIKINPSKIKIAADEAVLDTIEDNKVVIGQLNFAELSNKDHVLTYDITLPTGCKNLDVNTTTASVSVDLSEYMSKKVTVNNFKGVNIDLTKYNVVYNSSEIEVNVCGPSELIDGINAGAIIPKVDFDSKLDDVDENSVSLELPITFDFTKDYLDCWVYGDYTISVIVTKKQ